MRPVLGYTTLYSQRIIGLKKNIPAYLLQYEAHNISISPRIGNTQEITFMSADFWSIQLYPLLGASPGAKDCENGQPGILEVKCLFVIRDGKISDALGRFEKNSTPFISPEHNMLKGSF